MSFIRALRLQNTECQSTGHMYSLSSLKIQGWGQDKSQIILYGILCLGVIKYTCRLLHASYRNLYSSSICLTKISSFNELCALDLTIIFVMVCCLVKLCLDLLFQHGSQCCLYEAVTSKIYCLKHKFLLPATSFRFTKTLSVVLQNTPQELSLSC